MFLGAGGSSAARMEGALMDTPIRFDVFTMIHFKRCHSEAALIKYLTTFYKLFSFYFHTFSRKPLIRTSNFYIIIKSKAMPLY